MTCYETMGRGAFSLLLPSVLLLHACGSGEAAPDAGAQDAGVRDAGAQDAGLPQDAGAQDAGPADAGPVVVPDPDSSGGALTNSAETYGVRPFLTPAHRLDLSNVPDYSNGREMYAVPWEVAPSSSFAVDGLGPLYNSDSCVSCHPASGRAPGINDNGTLGFGLFLRLSGADGGPHVTLGGQLQPRSIGGVPVEGTPHWEAVAMSDTDPYAGNTEAILRRFTITPQPEEPVFVSPRLSPQIVGVGLLEFASEAMILERADPDDADGDGISGRAARPQGAEGPLGRFGWKAVNPRVIDQAAGAFAGDMGITSPLKPETDCTAAQTACLAAEDGADATGDGYEVSQDNLDAVAHFLWHQGVPAARRTPGDPQIEKGAALFHSVGCESCHRETLRTEANARYPLLSEQIFHPYTDLLLHDMGEHLADEHGEGDAQGAEWRTPPLWVVGLIETGANPGLLHDGRAKTIQDAVFWHGGEAEATRNRFLALSEADRAALLAFVRSL